MTNNPLAKLSVPQLKRAVAIREQINGLAQELDRIMTPQSSPAKTLPATKKSKVSAATRAKLTAAMKARWAKIRAEQAKKGQSR